MLYNEALNTLQIDNIYLTRVCGKFDCDKTFVDKKSFYEKINNYVLGEVSPFKCENEIYYRFFHYTYKVEGN